MDRLEQLPESERIDRYARLARKALAAYRLSDAHLTHRRGATNTTFEVSTGDPARHYALRICPPERPPDDLQREILWLTALRRDTKLAVPEPILSMDGKLVLRVSIAGVSGFRPCVLLRWVDGAPLDSELEPDHLRSVGRLLATLHAHAETFRWPEEITPPRRNATLMSTVLDEKRLRRHYGPAQIDLLRQAIDRIAMTMAELRDGPAVAGVIHADLHRRSVLFRATEARAVGFDRCRWGYYAYDLAAVRSWIERREEAGALIAALVEGYRSIRDLPDEVQASVPVFSALRSIDRIQSILARPHVDSEATRTLDAAYANARRLVDPA